MAYNPFVNEEARDSYFDYEQAVILNFWLERVREMGTVTSEQLQLGVILEERVIEPSIPQVEGQVSFECGSWDGLSDDVGAHEAFMVKNSERGLDMEPHR